MSSESLEMQGNRDEKIKKAVADISENILLSRDELTLETVENKFIVNGAEVDPDEWIKDRLAFLEDDQKNGTSTVELTKKVLEDLEAGKGN